MSSKSTQSSPSTQALNHTPSSNQIGPSFGDINADASQIATIDSGAYLRAAAENQGYTLTEENPAKRAYDQVSLRARVSNQPLTTALSTSIRPTALDPTERLVPLRFLNRNYTAQQGSQETLPNFKPVTPVYGPGSDQGYDSPNALPYAA
jgi:hypothetical protein